MARGALRPPAVAGQFYPSDAVELTQLLEGCFTGRRGPGRLPPPHRSSERHLRALIVPHAGWIYSGEIAAHAYSALAADRAPEVVLLLGVNHRGRGAPAALASLGWETPIGPIATDAALLSALRRAPIEVDDRAHASEHSLEVQMPFLDYVLPKPSVVGLSVSWGSLGFLTEVAAVVRRALRGRDVLLVASTDFSHYVPPEMAQRLDRRALDAIATRQAETLYDTVRSYDISMCGVAPTTVLLSALEEEPLEVRELRWGHSGEAEPMADVVGYASLLLESATPL
ncbi:MAG TPA: AmmeMemoRadiSam system protein B [Thermoplasmata archaeon]|nr:AmmeMemoRadiSam system protein B [Thermoplasmata archaeon]